jgi:hypothetical protein
MAGKFGEDEEAYRQISSSAVRRFVTVGGVNLGPTSSLKLQDLKFQTRRNNRSPIKLGQNGVVDGRPRA